MKPNRLLASGCSYTDYCWSTWADIIGTEFAEYRQTGMGGADNATIARSIVSNACPGDIVVVMWSSYDRWSFYSEKDYPMPKDSNNHWRHLGAASILDKHFFVNYYHKVERFQTTMDYVQLVDLHSQVNGYTAYHFSAFPFFLGETEKNVDPRIVEIYNRYNIKNNYLTEISLYEYRLKNYNILTSHKYTTGDTHPTPLCHYEYMKEYIAPKLGISLTPNKKFSIIKEQDNLINHGITIR
jgi:hypothetical protein